MNKGQFKIQKISDVGTSNPIVSRLSMGLHDIVNMAQISKSSKDLINAANHSAMQSIVRVEKIGLPICRAIDSVIEQLEKEGVKTQSFDRCVEVPSTEGLESIREFLKYGKKALQDLMPIFNSFLGTNYSNPRYDKLFEDLKKQYGENDPLSALLKEDHDLWIKKLLDYRNEDEHPTREELYHDFDINWDEGVQKWIVIPPKFYDGSLMRDFVTTSIHNLLTFTEEINVLFLQRTMPPIVEIREIPKEQRNPDCEIRFRIELKDGFGQMSQARHSS